MMEHGCSRHSPCFLRFEGWTWVINWTLMNVDSGQRLVGRCWKWSKNRQRGCRPLVVTRDGEPLPKVMHMVICLGHVKSCQHSMADYILLRSDSTCVLFISIRLEGLYLRPLLHRKARTMLFSPPPPSQGYEAFFLKILNINFTRTLHHLQEWRKEFQGVPQRSRAWLIGFKLKWFEMWFDWLISWSIGWGLNEGFKIVRIDGASHFLHDPVSRGMTQHIQNRRFLVRGQTFHWRPLFFWLHNSWATVRWPGGSGAVLYSAVVHWQCYEPCLRQQSTIHSGGLSYQLGLNAVQPSNPEFSSKFSWTVGY